VGKNDIQFQVDGIGEDLMFILAEQILKQCDNESVKNYFPKSD
jgi:hypothetical protein